MLVKDLREKLEGAREDAIEYYERSIDTNWGNP